MATAEKKDAVEANVRLWDAVRTPDPAFTKTFTGSGGFRGTAITSTYLVRLGTEQWGPVGDKWGYDIVEEQYRELGQIAEGVQYLVHVARIRLWYTGSDGERKSFEHFGQTTMVGLNRHGVFRDEDAPKKSVTDGLSKCLSMLGFGADVHMGLFDDNKYLMEARDRFSGSAGSEAAAKESGADSGKVAANVPFGQKKQASKPAKAESNDSTCSQVLRRIAASEVSLDAVKEWLGTKEAADLLSPAEMQKCKNALDERYKQAG